MGGVVGWLVWFVGGGRVGGKEGRGGGKGSPNQKNLVIKTKQQNKNFLFFFFFFFLISDENAPSWMRKKDNLPFLYLGIIT